MDERSNKWKFCIFIIFFISFINPASSQTAGGWVERGNALYYLGAYNKAIEAYDKAIAIDPNYKEAWNGKGAAFFGLGEYKKAIEAFDRSIIIDPNDKEVWFIKGAAFAGLGEYNKAIEASDRALAIDPNYKEAWYGKGVDFIYLGEYNKAIEASDRALAIDPNYKEAKEMKELATKEMAGQTSTSPISNQENNWIIISGIAIFIIIGIIVLRNRKNKSNIDSLKNTNNMDYKINKWKKFCQKCGAELKEDSKFCSSCGFSLQKAAIIEEKKGIVGQFIEAVKLSFTWSGRFSRRQFLLILFGGNLTVFLIGILLWFLVWDEDLIFKFVDLGVLIFLLVFVGAMVRRLHDLDKSGWYALLFPIPFAGFVLLVYLIFEQGKEIEKTRWG